MIIMAKNLNSETTLDYVSPDLLDFDPSNPRFGGLMDNHNQRDIQQALYSAPYYASELIDSLLANGFIDYEPLVVKRNNNRYIVIEGNRRLAAIRQILENPSEYHGRKSDLTRIPVLIFPERPDEQHKNEMRVYLGVRHLLGFRGWPPLSKAQYLERESKSAGGLDKVIEATQMSKTNARRFLVPYRLLQLAKEALPPDEDFWVLGEALSRTGIKNFLQLEVDSKTLEIINYDKRNFGLLLNDLYGVSKGNKRDGSSKIVRDTRDLKRLARVVSSVKAASALHAGRSLEEAEILVDSREESLARLVKVSKELGSLLKKLLSDNKDDAGSDIQRLYKQFDAAVKIYSKAK